MYIIYNIFGLHLISRCFFISLFGLRIMEVLSQLCNWVNFYVNMRGSFLLAPHGIAVRALSVSWRILICVYSSLAYFRNSLVFLSYLQAIFVYKNKIILHCLLSMKWLMTMVIIQVTHWASTSLWTIIHHRQPTNWMMNNKTYTISFARSA